MPGKNTSFSAQKNITLSDIFFENLKRWYIIAITVFVLVLTSVIYTLGFITPMYKSTAKLYITNKQSNTITSSDLNISTYLSRDFAEIIVDDPILQQVSEDLGGKYSANALKRCVSVSTPENTRIIEITALSPSAADSKKIVDSVCRISEVELVEIMGMDRVKTIRTGNLPANAYSPNIMSNIIFAFFCSLFLAEAIIIIIYILNNRISSAEDVERYLGLSILATIPYNDAKAASKT